MNEKNVTESIVTLDSIMDQIKCRLVDSSCSVGITSLKEKADGELETSGTIIHKAFDKKLDNAVQALVHIETMAEGALRTVQALLRDEILTEENINDYRVKIAQAQKIVDEKLDELDGIFLLMKMRGGKL